MSKAKHENLSEGILVFKFLMESRGVPFVDSDCERQKGDKFKKKKREWEREGKISQIQ